MPASSSGFFVTVSTPKGSTVRRVEGDLLSVGRAEDCNLRIVHAELGRRHLSLMLQEGRCCVEDHGSTNGTYVNGKRIPAHVPTPVNPHDQVQLGQSGIRLNVSTDSEPQRPTASSTAESEITKTDSRIVTSTVGERQKAREAVPSPAPPKTANLINEQSERLLFEAQKKAAMLLQQAEIESERKVQDIYRKAEDAVERAEQAYQRKLNEAFRESEQVYQKAQTEAAQILEAARQHAAEIRTQADVFVEERRRRTDEDCERHLSDAQKTARELKENRLLEADDLIRAKEEELLKEARQTMSQRLDAFEKDLQRDADRQRGQLIQELDTRRADADTLQREQEQQIDKLKLEVRQLVEVGHRERKTLEELESSLEQASEKANTMKAAAESAAAHTATTKSEAIELRAEIGKLEKHRLDLQAQSASLHDEERMIQNRLKDARETVNTDLLKLKEQLEAAKIKLSKDERDHLEQLKLETNRKTRNLQQQMFEELQEKKVRIAREINLAVETFLKENPQPRSLKTLQDELTRQLDVQIVTLSKDPSAKSKQMSLIALKKAERWRIRLGGVVVGAALLWAGQAADLYVRQDGSPLQRKVAAANEEQKLDLERRKFNPPQVADLKDSYVDAVIYTQNFSTTYLADDFQKKYLQALSPYLLKTWRLEEDKSIELLAASASLVKELNEKRENIHPDFVQKDIEKMHELEAQSVTHMQQILGSEVRYESFKKFEKQFYTDYKR